MKHFKANVDKNQAAIVKGLRKLGAYVKQVHQVKNFTDLIVVWRGATFIVEIKNKERLPSKFWEKWPKGQREYLESMLEPGERETMEAVQAAGGHYIIAYDVESCVKAMEEAMKSPGDLPGDFKCKGCGHSLHAVMCMRTPGFCYLCDPAVTVKELLESDNDPSETMAAVRSCDVCGCTDLDCRQCIEKTGQPCHWVGPNLCSACADTSFKPGTHQKCTAGPTLNDIP